MEKYLSAFGKGKKPSQFGAAILGGKGHYLSEMAKAGVNVPSGVTITTAACHAVKTEKDGFLSKLVTLAMLDLDTGKLHSVRSGAPVSMPGMMDTVLNVGIFQANIEEFEKTLGARTAWDCYRRFLQMFGEVVLEIDAVDFENNLNELKIEEEVDHDSELSVDALVTLSERYEMVYAHHEVEVPNQLMDTLVACVQAVFGSWNSERAIAYRKMNKISDDMGTAVTIQQMVFGNMNDQSATGVLFTRNPATGAKGMVGEFLVNAQGEDVVAGIRTPLQIEQMGEWNQLLLNEVEAVADKLEAMNRDAQDIEFTIQNGELFILQTRNAKRTGKAAFRIAHDLAVEGVITKSEAVDRVSSSDYLSATIQRIDPAFKGEPLMTGMPASPGIATGNVVKSSAAAVAAAAKGLKVILVTKDTNPDDFPGMAVSRGILTATGGHTCHAAVVARGMNVSAIVGAGDAVLNLPESMLITLDGAHGNVYAGEVPVVSGANDEAVKTVLGWAFELKKIVTSHNVVIHAKDDAFFKEVIASLPEAGSIELTVAELRATGCRGLSKLLAMLKGNAKLGGVINLGGRQRQFGNGDVEFLAALGAKPVTDEQLDEKFSRHHVADLCSKQWNAKFQSRWTVRLPSALAGEAGKLQAAGWTVNTEVTKEMLAHIAALGLTVEEFTKAMNSIGKGFAPIVQTVAIEQAAFEVLK